MPASNPYLKRERQLKGWSQVHLAKQIEVSDYYISRWERGEVMPSPYYQQKLCDLFGKTAEELGFLQPKESGFFASSHPSEEETLVEDISSTTSPDSIVSSDNGSMLPVSSSSTFSNQITTQSWLRERNVSVLLLLTLVSLVVVVLLFSIFDPALVGILRHAPLEMVPSKPTATSILSQTVKPASAIVQINAGGPSVGSYVADTDYSEGSVWSTTNTVSTAGVSDPAPESVYQSSRYGYDFTYLIPHLTPNQAYKVRLHFAAMSWTQKGQNVFNVKINGNTVLSFFDINVAAGGTDRAVVESFITIARSDGTIFMQFDADEGGYVIVSGIQVLAD